MAIPGKSDPCWTKLANGGLDRIPTQQLSVNLLRQRLARSPAPSSEKAEEIRRFFETFERVLQSELSHISRL
jgi:hypothetical protein